MEIATVIRLWKRLIISKSSLTGAGNLYGFAAVLTSLRPSPRERRLRKAQRLIKGISVHIARQSVKRTTDSEGT
jgi:hypothetical protein